MNPLRFAIGEDFTFPDRHVAFQFIHDPWQRIENRLAMRATATDQDTRFTDRNLVQTVNQNDSRKAEPVDRNFTQPPHLL